MLNFIILKTGTHVGDAVECQAIAEMFGDNRTEPLLIGSVKAQSGHAEVSSGLISLLKILAVIKTGIIPANIYAESIDYTLEGLKDGRLKVSGYNRS